MLVGNCQTEVSIEVLELSSQPNPSSQLIKHSEALIIIFTKLYVLLFRACMYVYMTVGAIDIVK